MRSNGDRRSLTQRTNPNMAMMGDAKEGSCAGGIGRSWPRDETFGRSQETSVQEDDTARIPSVFGFGERRNCFIREVLGIE